MPYLDSLTPALPFSEPTTSREAAVAAQDFAASQRSRVLAWLRDRWSHGGTQKEAAEALDIARQSVCPRFDELEKSGDIIRSVSERRLRCRVYFVVRR
jgi:DNA-binding MarR family transcriptional regulator